MPMNVSGKSGLGDKPIPVLLFALLILFAANMTQAQMVTTTITSSGLGTHVSTSGATTTITGGTRPGNGGNLFHSFGSFSVGAPDTANFSNETGLPTTNILSRVTGGEASNIFGTLKTTNFGHAALWLINPAGIVFGPTASLNVGGALHVSTADYLRLGTDKFFYADLSKNSTLSMAPVEAFGFLGDTSPTLAAGRTAGISIQGLDTQGSSVVLLGRDAVAGSGGPAIPGVAVTGRLASQGGNVTLSSVHGAGSAGVDALNLQEFSEGGRISLTEAGVVDVTHPTDPDIGGRIIIRGGQFTMIGPDTALTASVANGPAPAIDVEVTDSLLIEAGTLSTRTAGAKDAGNISLNGKNVYLKKSTLSSSSADRSTGNAGSVTLRVDGLFSSQASTVSSEAKQGAGGNISVSAEDIRLTKDSPISAKSGGTVPAGNISLNSASTLLIQDSSVMTLAEQSGGNINLTADNKIRLTNSAVISRVQAGSGSAGSITFDSAFIALKNSIVFSTAVFGGGGPILGGPLTLTATSAILIDSFSLVDANSQFGITKLLSGTIAPLPGTIVEVAGLYSAKCAGQKGGAFNSFTVQGRDRIPVEPGDLIPTPLMLADINQRLAPTSEHPTFPMATRSHLPPFAGGLSTEHIGTLDKNDCHS